jgi:mRNA interferase MazF
VPNRGDIVWTNLDPRTGHEQSGRRVLVLSRELLATRTGLMVVCPITSKAKGAPHEVPIHVSSISGVVLPIHLRSIDYRARGALFIARAPEQVLRNATQKASILINGL